MEINGGSIQKSMLTPQREEVTMTEKIITTSGCTLLVETRHRSGQTEISLRMENRKECFLHWGLTPHAGASWQVPPEWLWPEGTRGFGQSAVQTPFLTHDGETGITIRLGPTLPFLFLDFALFFPGDHRWDNNHGKNYRIPLPGSPVPSLSPVQVLREEIKGKEVFFEQVVPLDGDSQLAIAVIKGDGNYQVTLLTDIPGPLIFHWGVAGHSRQEWQLPPASIQPPGTVEFQGGAAQTPFDYHNGPGRLRLELDKREAPLGIPFVLKRSDTGGWLKDRGDNFFIPLEFLAQEETPILDPQLSRLSQAIVNAEMSPNSWTLMHRFNLCHDLLDQVKGNPQGLALLFVWLRFSALRQLDWQRNYNTKPRELSHALDRLTDKLTAIYASEPASREWIRMIMTTLGRGGEGQKIRDEILEIMHRHHLKEVSGHFMEEWHQKIHNNTTPDDVVIG